MIIIRQIFRRINFCKTYYTIGDISILDVPKGKDVKGIFKEMDHDQDGKIRLKEIDPDMNAYLKYKPWLHLFRFDSTFQMCPQNARMR